MDSEMNSQNFLVALIGSMWEKLANTANGALTRDMLNDALQSSLIAMNATIASSATTYAERTRPNRPATSGPRRNATQRDPSRQRSVSRTRPKRPNGPKPAAERNSQKTSLSQLPLRPLQDDKRRCTRCNNLFTPKKAKMRYCDNCWIKPKDFRRKRREGGVEKTARRSRKQTDQPSGLQALLQTLASVMEVRPGAGARRRSRSGTKRTGSDARRRSRSGSKRPGYKRPHPGSPSPRRVRAEPPQRKWCPYCRPEKVPICEHGLVCRRHCYKCRWSAENIQEGDFYPEFDLKCCRVGIGIQPGGCDKLACQHHASQSKGAYWCAEHCVICTPAITTTTRTAPATAAKTVKDKPVPTSVPVAEPPKPPTRAPTTTASVPVTRNVPAVPATRTPTFQSVRTPPESRTPASSQITNPRGFTPQRFDRRPGVTHDLCNRARCNDLVDCDHQQRGEGYCKYHCNYCKSASRRHPRSDFDPAGDTDWNL